MDIMKLKRSYTLLEIMIVTALLSVALILAMEFMTRTSDEISIISHEAWLQSAIQNAIDEVTTQVQESSADHMTLFRFTDPAGGTIELPDGSTISSTQVAICYPTPRDVNGTFVFTTGTGANVTISAEPVWQGVTVLAYFNAELWQYTDYNSHTFNDQNPITITAVSATTITLSDGTTFNRAGTAGSNQTIRRLMIDLAQVEVPNFVSGTQVSSLPMQIQITAQKRVTGGTFNQGSRMVSASLMTDVLTRNKN